MGFFTRSASHGKHENSSKKSFFSLPSISTSNSSMSNSQPSDGDEDDAKAKAALSFGEHRGANLKLRTFSSRTTEPTTSASASHSDNEEKLHSFSSAEAPTVRSRNTPSSTRPPIMMKTATTNSSFHNKIGSAVARSRSSMSAISKSSKKSLSKRNSKKKLSNKSSSSKRTAEIVHEPEDTKHDEDIEKQPTDEVAQQEKQPKEEKHEFTYRVKLAKDMTLLADAIHLDNNTRTLLASYDAKTIDDFFMMGEIDFQHLLAKARNSNRGLPPLQIRKVRVLREWITELIEKTHPDVSGVLPWITSLSKEKDKNDTRDDTLLPKDWKHRFQQDLPKLKKKLRRKGDSFAEVFPWLSFFFGFRDSFCGSRY